MEYPIEYMYVCVLVSVEGEVPFEQHQQRGRILVWIRKSRGYKSQYPPPRGSAVASPRAMKARVRLSGPSKKGTVTQLYERLSFSVYPAGPRAGPPYPLFIEVETVLGAAGAVLGEAAAEAEGRGHLACDEAPPRRAEAPVPACRVPRGRRIGQQLVVAKRVGDCELRPRQAGGRLRGPGPLERSERPLATH